MDLYEAIYAIQDVVYSEQWKQPWKPIAKSSATDPVGQTTIEEGKCRARH